MINKHEDDIDDEGASSRYINWDIQRIHNGSLSISESKTIEYNYYKFSALSITTDSATSGDTLQINGNLLVYKLDDKIRYIINKNTGAQALIRKLLKYTGRKEIEELRKEFSSDLFMWLIKKVYLDEADFEDNQDKTSQFLSIDRIKGFRGRTNDLSNTVTAKGQTVMKLISTISFLIETGNLRQLSLNISYKDHELIEISLKENGVVGYEDKMYLGELNYLTDDQRIPEITLLLFTEIVPIIRQKFDEEKNAGLWNTQVKTSFLSTLAQELQEKINNRINELKDNES